ncbi:MAG TPA: hypothetical protein VH913_26775 [Hyphomicrobiaceae bacterium]|jgi:hypothetical protein
MHQNTAYPDRFGSAHDPQPGIAKELASQALSLLQDINCQAAENDHGDRVGYIASKAARGDRNGNAACC